MRRFILISLVGLAALAVSAPSRADSTPPSAPTVSTRVFVPTDGRTASSPCSTSRSASGTPTA